MTMSVPETIAPADVTGCDEKSPLLTMFAGVVRSRRLAPPITLSTPAPTGSSTSSLVPDVQTVAGIRVVVPDPPAVTVAVEAVFVPVSAKRTL